MMKILKWLDEHLEEYILVILSVFTVVVIFSQVVLRYIFSSSLPWSEEIARYAFIWMIYIGVSYGVKRQKHLSVDVITMLFERKGQIVINIISNLLFLIFALVITYYGINIVGRITRESAALEIPMEYVYLALVVGMVLTTIRLLQNIYSNFMDLKNGRNDEGLEGGTS